MSLTAWLDVYISRRSLDVSTERRYRYTVAGFIRWCGRDVLLDSAVDEEMLSRFLRYLHIDLGRSAYTVGGTRRVLLMLLEAAADDGLCRPLRKRQVRNVRMPALLPKCLTTDQATRLLAACDAWEQYKPRTGYWHSILPNGKPRGLFFKTFVATAWDTALRLSDVLDLQREWIDEDGRLALVQGKSGRLHRIRVCPETLALIDELMGGDTHGDIFPQWCSTSQFCRHFKRLTKFAGVPCTTKYIRRGSASQYERDNPGQAWKHLGHAGPGIDRKFYLNPNIAYPERPMVRSVIAS